MTSTAADSARLSRSDITVAARREVARAITSMVNDAVGRTATPLRTAGLIWPVVNGVEPEPRGQIEAARAIEQAAHALIGDLVKLAERRRYETPITRPNSSQAQPTT